MEETFRISKTGVKVYKRLKYHPLLKGTDTTHPDICRKAREVFDRGVEKGLPKICSEHSEDAMTWHYFSHLLKTPIDVKRRWLEQFLQIALEWSPRRIQGFLNHPNSVRFLFWHGKKVPPFFDPPPSLKNKEGRTEVDLAILAHTTTVVFVEAKYKSEISLHTTHGPYRDQIIRNIDVGTYYAKQHGYQNFSFILLADPKLEESKVKLDYMKNPQNILRALPHRKDLITTAESLSKQIGYIKWDQLPSIRTHPQ